MISRNKYLAGVNEYPLGNKNMISTSLSWRRYSISLSAEFRCAAKENTGGRFVSILKEGIKGY